jgi:hypothetical protein
MRIDKPHLQCLMKNLLNDKDPFYRIYLSEHIRNNVGKYLGTSSRGCPCFEYEGKVLMLLTNFPIFGGWIIKSLEELDIQDDIPLQFYKPPYKEYKDKCGISYFKKLDEDNLCC